MFRRITLLSCSLFCLSCSGQVVTENSNSSADDQNETGGGENGGSTSEGGNGGVSTGGDTAEEPPPTPRDCEAEDDVEAVAGTAVLWDRAAAGAASPESLDFFNAPWPEAGRTNAEYAGFPNPGTATGCTAAGGGELADLITSAIAPEDYRAYVAELLASERAPGRHPVIYLSFDGAVPQLDRITAIDSLDTDSPAFLMDVDPASPFRGTRIPIESRVFTSSRYLPENTAAFTPRIGFPLRADTRHALVVPRTGANSDLGSPVNFEALKGDGECSEIFPEYTETFDYLEREHMLAREDVAAMTVFQTGTPTRELVEVRDAINGDSSPNRLAQIDIPEDADDQIADHLFYRVDGTFQTVFLQQEDPPYLPQLGIDLLTQTPTVGLDPSSRDGRLVSTRLPASPDETDPMAPRTAPVPFTLTLPVATATGSSVELPLVIYGVGTGGSRQSPLDSGVASLLAEEGYAALTAEPVLHAERARSDNIDSTLLSQLNLIDLAGGTSYAGDLTQFVESGDLYFNPFQLPAARGNVQQNAIDYLWQAQVFAETELDITVDGSTRSITFSSVSFFGHSQGGSTGPLLAGSNALSSMVLSGAGGHIPSVLLGKTEPADSVNIANMLESIVCEDSGEPVDQFHPFLSLIGRYLEPADAELYASRMLTAGDGMDLFMIQGRGDAFSPNEGQEAIWAAAGLQEVLASDETPTTRIGQELLAIGSPMGGYDTTYATRSGNLGGLTGAFQEYSDASCSDPHFVFVCDAEAVSDWQAFYRSALVGVPVIE